MRAPHFYTDSLTRISLLGLRRSLVRASASALCSGSPRGPQACLKRALVDTRPPHQANPAGGLYEVGFEQRRS